ncbi:MAG TPA: hypothetical protein VFA81_03385 [Burkholderiales bacterium]|nr:hypothetical protein [Burkholderiales bacterium]
MTTTRASTAHITVRDASARLTPAGDPRSVPLFEHGTPLVKYYAPRGVDKQTPHTRDEVYVVAQGSCIFFDGSTRRRCGIGDVLFVAAGITHAFEEFTDDFGVWVMFYGPEGGEQD